MRTEPGLAGPRQTPAPAQESTKDCSKAAGEEVMGTGWGQDVARMRTAIRGPVVGNADWNQRGLDFSSASTMYQLCVLKKDLLLCTELGTFQKGA